MLKNNNIGKPIETTDESKVFQKKCLEYGQTLPHYGAGIDIETVYYAKIMGVDGITNTDFKYQYYIFEYLKDDCPYFVKSKDYDFNEPDHLKNRLTPWKSDPNKYTINWRKFLSLYVIATKLNGQLVLVNYSDGYIKDNGNTKTLIKAPEGFDNQVKVMYVETIDWDKLKQLNNKQQIEPPYIIFSEERCMTFAEYAIWLQKMNQNSKLPTVYNKNKTVQLFP